MSERNDPMKDTSEALRVYEQIVSGVPDHLSYVDRNYTYQAVNEAYLVAHATSRDRIVGRKVYELLGEDTFENTVRPSLDRCLAGETINYQAWFDFVGKGRRLMDVSYFPYRDRSGDIQGVVVNARDITERRQLEEQLLHSQKMQAIGRLAGGIAHDFNNYLTVILSCLEVQKAKLPTGAPGQELIHPMHQAARNAASLTSQLLAFARKQVIDPAVVDVNHIVHNVIPWLDHFMREKVELETALAEQELAVEIDPGQLEQVLVNLAINARDAMPEGGKLTIRTDAVHWAGGDSTSVLPPGSYVRIRLEDTGQGIPEDVLPHVFEPFFTTKDPGGGTGLGLATCHGIIEQNGGTITAHSTPGAGTTFEIHFPRSSSPVADRTQAHATAEREPRGTILVVEDEPLVRAVAVTALREGGWTVLEAENVQQALQTAQEHPGPLDVLMTDLVLPDSGGLELADQLQSRRPGLRVLCASGYAEEPRRYPNELAKRGRMFLPKPYTPDQLFSRLRTLLGSDDAP